MTQRPRNISEFMEVIGRSVAMMKKRRNYFTNYMTEMINVECFCRSDKNIGHLKQTANETFTSRIDRAIPEYGIFDEKEDKELGINSKNIIRAYLEEKKILDGHDYEDYYMGSEKG